MDFRFAPAAPHARTAVTNVTERVSSGEAFTGHTILTLNPGAVWDSIDFGYLEISIPRIDSHVGSLLLGWVTEH